MATMDSDLKIVPINALPDHVVDVDDAAFSSSANAIFTGHSKRECRG